VTAAANSPGPTASRAPLGGAARFAAQQKEGTKASLAFPARFCIDA
jgi:hypothetical protein